MSTYKFGSVHQTQLGSIDGKHLALIKPARVCNQEQPFILRLPTEILSEIFQYVVFHIHNCFSYEVDNAPELLYTAAKRLSLVCHRFNGLVLPLFYHNIYIRAHAQSSLSLRKVHAVLRDKPWLQNCCKRLDIGLAYSDAPTNDTLSKVHDLVSCLRNVHTFGISCGPKQLPNDTVEIIRTATQHMPRIETLIFNHHCHTFFSEDILKHVSFPSLRALTIRGMFTSARPGALTYTNEPEPKMDRTGTFTSLLITDYEEDFKALGRLIQWPASLVHFQLLDWSWRKLDYIDLPMLGECLSIHRKTLKTIEIGNLSLGGYGTFFDLSNFAKLEALTLSWVQMGRWLTEQEEEELEEGELQFSEEDANLLLAPNLHTLTLHFGPHDENSDSWHYFGKAEEHWVREFAKAAISRKAALRKIQIYFNPCRNSFKEKYGYPWDRMERTRDEFQQHGFTIDYNKPSFTKEQWRDYVKSSPSEEDSVSSSGQARNMFNYFQDTFFNPPT